MIKKHHMIAKELSPLALPTCPFPAHNVTWYDNYQLTRSISNLVLSAINFPHITGLQNGGKVTERKEKGKYSNLEQSYGTKFYLFIYFVNKCFN